MLQTVNDSMKKSIHISIYQEIRIDILIHDYIDHVDFDKLIALQ